MALIGHQPVGWADGSATPSTTITVPTGATHVLFLATWWQNAMSSISLTDGTLEDSFDFAETGAFAGYSRGAVRLWSVSSIGSKTLSATFAAGPSDGPCAFVVYLDEAPTLPDADYAGDSGSDVTQAVTLTGLQVDDLVFAIDTRDDSTTAPGNESGWTSLDTAAHNLESGRLRYIAAAGSSVTATSQPTVSWAHVIAAAVRFTPPGPPTITTTFDNFSGNNGGTVTLHGDAVHNGGTGMSYQWQEDTGGGWTNVGTDSPTYDVTGISAGMIGYQWRVQATDSDGTTNSAAATLTSVITDLPQLAAMGELALGEIEADAAPGTVNLAAAGTAQATGTATPLKEVSLAGSGLSVATGTAGAQLSVPLNAVGLAVAAGSGGLQLTISMAGAGLAQAVGAANLALAKLLAASGAGQAAGTAALDVGAGAGPVSLAAAGQAQAAGTATLSLVIHLQAAAVAQAQGLAGLAVGKQLGAAGQALASGGAALWLEVPLGAAGLAQASGAGGLQLLINLPASGLVQATGAAQLQVGMTLQADGQAVATGTAGLSVLLGLDGVRGLVAPVRARNWSGEPTRRFWARARRARTFAPHITARSWSGRRSTRTWTA